MSSQVINLKENDNINNINENENKGNKGELKNERIYELKYIKFIIKDYMSFPRTERAKLLMIILNIPFSISELEKQFSYILYGFNFKPKDN